MILKNPIVFKYTSLLIIVGCFILNYLSAQTLPPNLYFDQLNPHWIIVPKDTNFIQSPIDPFSSPYWGIYPEEVLFTDNYLFILNGTISQSPYGGSEGSLLYKIDLKSGNIIWILHSNTYTGNVFREQFKEGCMKFLENGNIEVIGVRDMDTIDYTLPVFWGFYGKPVRKVINAESGQLSNLSVSPDSIKSDYNLVNGFNRLLTNSNGDNIYISYNALVENGELVNSYDFYRILGNLQTETPYYHRIKYETGLDELYFPGMNYSTLRNFNLDTLVCTFVKEDTIDSKNSPIAMLINLVDISDSDNINLINQIDVSDVIFRPQYSSNGRIEIVSKNDHLLLYQKCLESLSPAIWFYWMAWYDMDGNLLGSFYNLKDELNSYYKHIIPIGVFNGNIYLAALKSNSFTYDILKIETNSQEFERVGKIKLVNSYDFTSMYLIRADQLPNNDVLLSFSFTKNNQNGKNTNFTYYVKTSFGDLGVITSNNQTLLHSNTLNVFPNPVRQILSVQSNALTGSIYITDMLGRKQEVKATQSDDTHQIDVSGLIPGCYQLSVLNEQGYLTGTARFIKVE